MRVLFIAPTSNLSSNAELARIASGNTLEICDGAVDRAGLERALRDPYDVVHFVGHGDKSILQLSDEMLDSADLVSMLGAQRSARFFFLNTCNSLAVATAIHNALHVPVLAHDAPIDDKAAVHFATVFYRRWKQIQNVAEAFDAAKESLLRLYPTQASIPVLINGDMATKNDYDACMEIVQTRLGAMDVKIDRIEAKVGDIRGAQTKTVVILLGLLLLAQLVTPILNGLLVH